MPDLEPMEIIETVCSVCQMPATRVSGQWLHVDWADAVFCMTVMRGHDWFGLDPKTAGDDDEDSDEAVDARSEQAHESRYGLHRDGFADND